MPADEYIRVLTSRDPLVRAFRKFHKANPNVFRLFDRFTREAMAAGHLNFSAHAVIHRIRWETTVVTRSVDGFKISNNHFPYYARLWTLRNPEHDGFFVLRPVLADVWQGQD